MEWEFSCKKGVFLVAELKFVSTEHIAVLLESLKGWIKELTISLIPNSNLLDYRRGENRCLKS